MKLSTFVHANNFQLDFGALFAYSPYGSSAAEELSRSYRTAIKGDEPVSVSGGSRQLHDTSR
ncbi:MAG: hypothetical protein ACRD6W_19750 [Nitrososphaerales archaeon]